MESEPRFAPKHEIFRTPLALVFLKYRVALNRLYLATGVLWIAWCLYWPFRARNRDIREADIEAQETYKVCLQQRAASPADCDRDRTEYKKLLRNMVAPQQENVYQSFAGENAIDAIGFMFVLCLLPPLVVFAFLRLLLEVWLFLAARRPANLGASR